MTRFRWAFVACALASALALAGCGDDAPPTEPEWGAPPPNDTPLHTMQRFEFFYGYEGFDQYLVLLAADFRYEFSPQSDPQLVSQFGTSWGVSNDSASTANLYDGFTNGDGDTIPGAYTITFRLPDMQIIDDPDHPDSAAFYKLVIVPQVLLRIDVPGTDGYEIASPVNFQLVRGDAAALRAGQSATSDRWYIRRQKDLSPALARTPSPLAPARVLPSSVTTWGSVKANYL